MGWESGILGFILALWLTYGDPRQVPPHPPTFIFSSIKYKPCLQLWCESLEGTSLSRPFLSLFFFFLAVLQGMWDLSSEIRDHTHIPCIERWILNHWIFREAPNLAFSVLRCYLLLSWVLHKPGPGLKAEGRMGIGISQQSEINPKPAGWSDKSMALCREFSRIQDGL